MADKKFEKVAIYSRKSKFTDTGESIQNQINMCKDYAFNYFYININDIVIYEDEGFSGGNIDRPEFKRLLDDAKKKLFDALICYRLDRISRSVVDFSSTIEMLNKYNIAFVSIKEQFDTSTPMGRAMMYISSVFAQLERETIAERIKDNMYSLARTGRWLGGRTPTGYSSEAIEYLDEQLNKKHMYKLIPNFNELENIKIIFETYLKLGSLHSTETYLMQNNIHTRNNKYFDLTSITRILQNPVYTVADKYTYEYFKNINADIASTIEEFDNIHGLMVFNKNSVKHSIVKKEPSEWIVAVGKHNGLIKSMDWIKVQKQINEMKLKAPRDGTSKIGLISNLLRCSECGSKMIINYRKKSSCDKEIIYYYYCSNKVRSHGYLCNIKNLNGKKADKTVVEKLKSVSLNLIEINNISQKQISLDNQVFKDNNYKNKKLQKELKTLEQQIKNLTVQLSDNKESSSSKYIIAQIELSDKKIIEIEKELEHLYDKSESYIYNNILIQLYKEFNTVFDKLDFSFKKKYINQLIESIYWNGEDLKINLRNNI